jgi:hypothetical protein
MQIKTVEELWITNISTDKDVCLGDLRLTIKSGQSINLLATKKNGQSKFLFSRKNIDDSISRGSIFKKRDVIKVRKVAPVIFETRLDLEAESIDRSAIVNFKRKSAEIEVQEFPDLDMTEDQGEEAFAAENADLDFVDRKPVLSVDPKFNEESDE